MNKYYIAFIICLFVFASALPKPTQAQEHPNVFISEIAWAGSSLSNSDEWIELVNLSNTDVDLSGWTLAGAATSGGDLTIPQDITISANSTLIISNYEFENENSSLAQGGGLVTSSLSLSNTKLNLVLQDDARTPIDYAGADGAPFAGASGGTGENADGQYVSMVRVNPIVNGSLEDAWADATLSQGFDTDITDLGTPGIEDYEYAVHEDYLAELLTATTEDPADESDETQDNATQDSLVINEIVSNPPSGQDEWVEIFNPTQSAVDLTGWTLMEGSGKSTALPEQTLQGEQYVVVLNPSGNLNNSGDVVALLDPTLKVVDQVSYGPDELPIPTTGSLARNESNNFVLTKVPTPASVNVITDIALEVAEPEETNVIDTNQETDSNETAVDTQDETQTESTAVVDVETDNETQTSATTTQSNTATSDQTEALASSSSQTIHLSEIYPNTLGDDLSEEFIELINVGDESIDLQGWSLEDASGKRYTHAESKIMAPGSLVVLERQTTKISLNNTGDTVRLYAPDNSLVDEHVYENAKNGESAIRYYGVWTWTTVVTKNEPNRIPQAEPQATVEQPAQEPQQQSQLSTTSGGSTSTSSIKEATLTYFGIVLVEPGVLGKQIFFINTGVSGLQVYKYDSDFPAISQGDRVKVVGTKSTISNVERLKLSNKNDVQVLSSGNEVPTTSLTITQLDDSQVGQLVTTQGTILSRSGNSLLINDNNTSVPIKIASATNIDLLAFENGMKVKVTGILTKSNSTYQINPRSADDVEIQEDTLALAGATDQGKTIQASRNRSYGTWLVVAVSVLLTGFATRRALPYIKQKYVNKNLRFVPQKTN
ncbi:MAG: lamin tail domain-containing protein [Patescibacteria group bacterium]